MEEAMRGTITDTLEELGKLSHHALDIEIDYDFSLGEKTVMNPPDKAYPGSPPSVELGEVWVTAWHIGEIERLPAGRSVRQWAFLERIAYAAVERDWDKLYSEYCLEDAAEQLNQGRDETC
jgi:hypothetical protein